MATVTKISWEVRWVIKATGVEKVHRRPVRWQARNLMKLIKRDRSRELNSTLVENVRMYRVHEVYEPVEDKYYSVTKRAR